MTSITAEKTDAVEVTGDKNRSTQPNGDAPEYLTGWALISLALALMGSAFLLALDNTILATAIPRITSDFNSLNDIGWYGAAYLITQMSLLPTCGRIYTFYNVKWSYIALLLVFELGSIVCAVAPNSTTLIVGRAVAGVGAAGLLSGAAVIISYCVPLRKRAILMATLSGTYGIGSVTGPLIGGVITDNKNLTWRFCFWINLPFGAAGLAQIWWTLRKPPPAVKAGLSTVQKIRQLDLLGATFLISATTCLLLALQWGGIVFPWSDPRVFGSLIGFVLILIAFFLLQAKVKDSCTIPLYIFRNRTVCAASAFMMFLQLAMVTQTYYWPIYFQSVKNTSAKDSGVYMLPLCLSSAISTLAAGGITSKVGYYVPFMWIGAPILATGAGLYQLIRVHSPASEWIGYQIVSGIGYGLCTQIPIVSVQVVLDKLDVPTGCVVILFFQCLGGAMATSIAQNLFTDKLLKKLLDVDGVDAAAVVRAGAKEFRRLIPSELMGPVLEAFGAALRNVFLLSLASSVVALVVSSAMEWRKVPTDGRKDGFAGETVQAPATRGTGKEQERVPTIATV